MSCREKRGHARPYGENPYVGYDRVDQPPFLFFDESDGRLLPKERVATVTVGEVAAAFPYSVLEREGVVNYAVNGMDLAVFFKLGTASVLDGRQISSSKDIGATGIFESVVEGQTLTFKADGGKIVDDQTGSVWNILGHAVEGPLANAKLNPIAHGDHFWFSWAAFMPDTLIYKGTG